jgi:hypothetical protein
MPKQQPSGETRRLMIRLTQSDGQGQRVQRSRTFHPRKGKRDQECQAEQDAEKPHDSALGQEQVEIGGRALPKMVGVHF